MIRVFIKLLMNIYQQLDNRGVRRDPTGLVSVVKTVEWCLALVTFLNVCHHRRKAGGRLEYGYCGASMRWVCGSISFAR